MKATTAKAIQHEAMSLWDDGVAAGVELATAVVADVATEHPDQRALLEAVAERIKAAHATYLARVTEGERSNL